MEKGEKEQLLKEAVLSMNPQIIRQAGEKTGHPVRLDNDFDIVMSAAQMIVFFIPDAPPNIKIQAMHLLSMFGNRF